jgi:hypothetical protein
LQSLVDAELAEERRTYLTPASAKRVAFIRKTWRAAYGREAALHAVWRAAYSDALRKKVKLQRMCVWLRFTCALLASDAASCWCALYAQMHAAPPARAAAVEPPPPARTAAATAIAAAVPAGPALHAAPHPESVGACIARLHASGADALLSTHCCITLLSKMEEDPSCFDAACCAAAAEALVAALHCHALFSPLRKAGWLLMSKLLRPAVEDVRNAPKTKQLLTDTLHAALSCLRTHSACEDVIVYALSVLNIFLEHSPTSGLSCPLLQQAVLAVMHAHPSALHVQLNGCAVLIECVASLPAGCPLELDPAFLHTTVAAMRGHSTEEMLQTNAFCLIARVCEVLHAEEVDDAGEKDDDFITFRAAWQFVDAGIIEAAVAALRTHHNDTQLARNVCGVLYMLVHGSVEHAARAARAGALALRLPQGINAEMQDWWKSLRLDLEAAATAQADAAMAALLAEEEAERAERGSIPGQSKKQAAKRRGRGGANAGGNTGSSIASSSAAPLQIAGVTAEGEREAPGMAAAAEEAGASSVSAPSASAERRRRRAAAKAAKRAGHVPAESAVPAVAPSDAADEPNTAAMELEAAVEIGNDEAASWPPPAPAPPLAAPAPPAVQHAHAPLAAQLTAQLAAAQAALAKAEAEADAARCVICMDAPRCCVVLPCKHLVLCASPGCAAMMGQPARCPLCRRGVTDTMQLFV